MIHTEAIVTEFRALGSRNKGPSVHSSLECAIVTMIIDNILDPCAIVTGDPRQIVPKK